ncbi:MAG: VWA domain-containing protein [Treponema sp.]|jgi:hypothetical protein|nr:VWA domain-containing protein [Treponema sp.]
MKKVITPLLLFLGIVFFVSGQTPEPIDLILALDTSSSMSGSYREVTDYISGPFLKEFLKKGDTFHLISFSGSPHSEISRRIEGVGDVETILGRLFLMLPLDPYTDIAEALAYTERYTLHLPSSRPKKVVFITDGNQNPKPGTSAKVLDSGALETLVSETADRLRRNGTDFHLITFPSAGSAADGGPVQEKNPPAPPVPVQQPKEPQPEQPARQQPEEPEQPELPIQTEQRSNYLPLLICLGAILLLISGFIIFFITRKLKNSPNKTMVYVAGKDSGEEAAGGIQKDQDTSSPADYDTGRQHEKILPLAALLSGGNEKDGEEATAKRTLLVTLVVDDQNTNIGRRNFHSLKAGDVYTIGGGKLDDYFIFLAPVSAHIGDIQFDGSQCTFIPKKPQYFPEIGSRPVLDCIGKIIRVVSDKGYELTFHLEQYEDPLDALNKLLNSVPLPPKTP